ncbi:hypothetical protein ACX80V_16795 [Arthrobacter sp. MDT3-24]
MKPEKITPSGFGESRPLTPGNTEEERNINRRTDIVIASDQPDWVKALIPEAIAKDRPRQPLREPTEQISCAVLPNGS